MTRLFQAEATIEYARGKGSILPAGILVSGRRDGDRPVLEVALEESIPAASIELETMDGKSLGGVSLASKNTPFGSVLYGEIALGALPRVLRLRTRDGSARELAEFSFAIDVERGWAFPAPEFAGSLGGPGAPEIRVIHHGPRGKERCPGIVNVVHMATTPVGLRVDLVLDDAGETSLIEAHDVRDIDGADPGGDPVRSPTVPLFKRPHSPGRGQLLFRLGTARATLRFRAADGRELEALACRLDLVRRVLDGVSRTTEGPGPSAGEGALRTVEVPPGGVGGAGATPGAPPAAAPGASPASRKLDLLQEFQSYAREDKGRIRAPPNWPRQIGETGRRIGPPGLVFPDPAVRLEEVELNENGYLLEIVFDDGGLAAGVAAGREGKLLLEVPVMRATPAGVGIARLRLPPYLSEIVLFVRDRYGRAFPNVSARLDIKDETFTPFEPDPAAWYPQIKFGDRFDLGWTRCAMCRIPVARAQTHLLISMDPELRGIIRKRYAPGPDVRGICGRCLPEVEAERPSRAGWRRMFALGELIALVVRGGFAAVGALAPLTHPGSLLIEWLGPTGKDILSAPVAHFMVALGGGLFMALLPQHVLVRPVLYRARALLRRTDLPPPPGKDLVPAGVLLGALAVLAREPRPEHPALAGSFFVDLYPPAVLGSLLAAVVVLRVAMTLSWRLWAEQASEGEHLRRMGEIAELSAQLLRSRSREELERLLKILLLEGVRVEAYQLFVQDPKTQRYLPAHAESGPGFRFEVTGFCSGDSSLPGRVAAAGRPMTRQDVLATLGPDDPPLGDQQVKVCLPVGRAGRVDMVVVVCGFRDPGGGLHDLAPLLAALGEILNQAWERVSLEEVPGGESAAGGGGRDGGHAGRPTRESLVSTFGPYFPAEFLARAEEEPSLLGLHGESVSLTILVARVSGLDGLARGLPAPALVSTLSRIFAGLAPIVVRRGGFVEGYPDACLVAFFGRPRSLPDFAASACIAALELADRLEASRDELPPGSRGQLRLGVGLATGDVVLGNTGTPERFHYTVLGAPVALARALAGLAGSYDAGVLVDAATAGTVADRFWLRPLDQVRVPGRPGPLTVTELLARRDGPAGEGVVERVEAYRDALGVYLQGRFSEAGTRFESLLARFPDDGPGRRLRERCQAFRADPPRGFDGSVALDVPGVHLPAED